MIIKHFIVLLFLSVLLIGKGYCQSADSIPVAIKDVKEIPVYKLSEDSLQLVLTLEYAKAEIGNVAAWQKISKEYVPYQVELVYTKYPLDYSQWAMTYSGLMKARIQNLLKIDSSFGANTVDWYLVLQTQCKTGSEAKAMFHGFVIKYHLKNQSPKRSLPEEASYDAAVPAVPYEFSSEAASKVKKPKKITEVYSSEEIKNVVRGELILKDSTVLKIMQRHPEWKNSLVVMDWTASMYTFGAQLLLWHRLNLEKNISQVSYFVFFNDGDKKSFGYKEVGKTGGIYKASTNSLEDVMKIMKKTMEGGTGGEAEENDLEAVLLGVTKLKHFDEIILIADNSPVRDMSLLKQIKHPIRVIICDPINQWVNPEYIRIAFESGGSLHVIDEDIERLEQLSAVDSKINAGKYELKNGRVVKVGDKRD